MQMRHFFLVKGTYFDKPHNIYWCMENSCLFTKSPHRIIITLSNLYTCFFFWGSQKSNHSHIVGAISVIYTQMEPRHS
jgi:hypothetical protein